MANDIGMLRRSAVASTFGPGAVVDFRAGGAPVSVVVAGLEEWDSNFGPAGLVNSQSTREPRLQQKLGVAGFRLPPVSLGDLGVHNTGSADDRKRLIGVRFPRWLQCPQCDRIAPVEKWADDPGKPGRYCAKCTRKQPGMQRVYVIPVRFVLACDKGHLDDFPWHWWVGHKPDCPRKKGFLRLKSEGPGLAGLIVNCPECAARRSMDGVFNQSTWKTHSCGGYSHWLGTRVDGCEGDVRAMQRGASNLYFPVVESALSIPPWSDQLQEALGIYWGTLVNTEPSDRAKFIGMLAQGELRVVLDELHMTPEQLSAEIENRVRILAQEGGTDIRGEEYRQFTLGLSGQGLPDREFETRQEPVPVELGSLVAKVVRVVRLREVRALRGFTRINPPDGEDSNVAPISRGNLDWLPAIEVRGEGVFIQLDTSAVDTWEQREVVQERAKVLDERAVAEWTNRYGSGRPPRVVTPRLLLVHSLAHALMRQLTLSCGYSSASLRERLYISEGDDESPGMAALLVYTSTTDADGTLGGLQREGMPERIGSTFHAAIRAMEWCSSDPLCIEGAMATAQGLSLAACHACLLAPETSCEEFNSLLDRAMLVGTPDAPEIGFFTSILKGD